MTLEQIFEQVDQLSHDEVVALRQYLDKRDREQWVRKFEEAIKALQEGLTEQEVEEIVAAINYKYIEPVDDKLWQD